MNSRERVMKTLNHEEPDMVPVDMGSTENTTLCRIAYINLREYLEMPPDPDPYVINRMMDSVFPKEDLLEHYEIDFRAVRPSPFYNPKITELEDGFIDEYKIRWKKASFYYDMVEHPLENQPLEMLDSAVYADPYIEERRKGLREQAKKLYEEGYGYLGGGDYLPNVWHLTTAENQKQANIRIPELLKLRDASPGWPVEGVSVEPMLSPIDFSFLPEGGAELDWIICGAETGPGARPMELSWAWALRDQCAKAGVPFFMKKVSGRKQPPEDLMRREFPLWI